jgi:hypothetical protein
MADTLNGETRSEPPFYGAGDRKSARYSLSVSRTGDQFRGLDFKRIRDSPEHRDCHRRLRSLNLTDIPCAQPNPIGQVLLRPTLAVAEPTNVRRNRLLQIGHDASGRYRHDPSRNDASYSSRMSLIST